MSKKYSSIVAFKTNIRVTQHPVSCGAWLGGMTAVNRRLYTVEELVAEGFHVVKWEGRSVNHALMVGIPY